MLKLLVVIQEQVRVCCDRVQPRVRVKLGVLGGSCPCSFSSADWVQVRCQRETPTLARAAPPLPPLPHLQLENAGGRTGGIGTAAALLGRTAGGSGPPGHMHTPSAPSDAMSPAPARALSSAASLPLTGGATGPEPAQHQGPGQGPPDGPRVLAGPQEQLQMEAAAAVAATEKRGSAQAAAAATAAVEAADAETGGGA